MGDHKKQRLLYIRMLMPALLVAVLVMDGIFSYAAPKVTVPKGSVPAEVHGTAAAELELTEQKEETKKTPKGTAGKLEEAEEAGTYKDGVYAGSAQGFGGPITCEVAIEGGKITAVRIVSAAGEDAAYLNRARSLTNAIVTAQGTNVDAVSGATYSSNGIILAVRNALAKARIDGSEGETASTPELKQPTKPKTPTKPPVKPTPTNKKPVGGWQDGTYTGTAEGFAGPLTVSVTIKGGKIAQVKLGRHTDDPEYIGRAERTILPAIVRIQGTGVDAVSGATYSSYGILEAVNKALAKAVRKDGGADTGSSGGGQDDSGGSTGTGGEDGGTGAGGSDSGQNTGGTGGDSTTAKRITRTMWVYCDDDEEFEDYELVATYVIDGGKVLAIEDVAPVVSEPSNTSYIRAAVRGLQSQITAKPDLMGVDTVSGATCSSYALLQAGQLALREANQ